VGVENIVAFCTDGGSNYHSACRLLIAENPRIEHVPCATHVLDLLMEDVGRQAWAKEVVGRASELINYTRSHHWTRQYLRGVDGGKGLQMLRPAGTRFGTQHIAVSRLVELRSTLVTMVLCDAWKAEWAVGPKKAAAETFHDQIMDKDWWPAAELFKRLLLLPFKAMRATDSATKGMMGRIYELMLELTVNVAELLKEEGDGVLSAGDKKGVNEIVKRRWDESMACPLHVVGRILNPVNQEERIFGPDTECTNVFKAFIARHYGGVMIPQRDGLPKRATLLLQEGLAAFLKLRGSFGTAEAISDRKLVKEGSYSMEAWWEWHGTDHPLLMALACRVLTQPVSASSCERNWAVWDTVHTARRNRLGSEKCKDLVYVAHNWKVVHNWHMADEGAGVVSGNIPDAPVPAGYRVDREEEDEEGEDEELLDEYL
ncbi:hypothetical protein CLOP_g22814, partial [Closterium sp. NIES-67]